MILHGRDPGSLLAALELGCGCRKVGWAMAGPVVLRPVRSPLVLPGPAAWWCRPAGPMAPAMARAWACAFPPVIPALSGWPAAVRWRDPSANRSGAPPCRTAAEAAARLFRTFPALAPLCPGRRWLAWPSTVFGAGEAMITGGLLRGVL